ncbi:MAG: flavin reductase [Bacteroidales bacterium]|nr:flavin reductase [Bacteroidales bacterium]
MKSLFKTIAVESLKDNFFRRINREWMLITAGSTDHFNTMTASWGTLGILWNKPIAVCFVRPHRYTFQFTEKYNYFTLSFFNKNYRSILDFCGTHSGRDTDKVSRTGLIPLELGTDRVSFKQAELIFECRKMYADYIKPENFIMQDIIKKNYPGLDFHRFYIGEILNCYSRE